MNKQDLRTLGSIINIAEDISSELDRASVGVVSTGGEQYIDFTYTTWECRDSLKIARQLNWTTVRYTLEEILQYLDQIIEAEPRQEVAA